MYARQGAFRGLFSNIKTPRMNVRGVFICASPYNRLD